MRPDENHFARMDGWSVVLQHDKCPRGALSHWIHTRGAARGGVAGADRRMASERGMPLRIKSSA